MRQVYKVICYAHDKGAAGCILERVSLEEAERTGALMKQCGYKIYIIQDWVDE